MNKHQEDKESRFWWHWQNLKEDSPKAWLHGRAWLHQRPRGELALEWCVPTWRAGADLTLGGNHQVQIGLACWLFAFYITCEQWEWLRKWKVCEGWHGKEVSVALHDWMLWWRIWVDEHEWHSKTPKWRDGSFHILDFLLGKETHRNTFQEPVCVSLSLPEGSYPATVKLFTSLWKRSRWPRTTVMARAEVEVKGGVPVPGKGEDSWNCDDSAIFSLVAPATSVEEAVQKFIDTVNQTRERYGGKGWLPMTEKARDN